MSAPLVSVLVPARDAERFLAEALGSVLAQPVELELIVCDDGSRDGTRAVAESFAARVLRHDRPRGVVAARNVLLAAARGRYVAFLDADDAYLPGGLAAQVELLERRADVALVHAAAEIVDEGGRELPAWRRPFDRDVVEDGAVAFGELLLSNELVTSTVVVRRSALHAAGDFVHVGPSSSDWDMWLRVALQGAIAYRATPVARYRQHAASISHVTTASGARLRCDARVVRRALSLSPRIARSDGQWSRRARSALAAKAVLAAGDFQARGERRAALRGLALAARNRPDLGAGLAALARAIVARDDYAAFVASHSVVDRLAGALVGTRYGGLLATRSTPDPDWEATLRRIARTVRTVTPPEAVLGTVTKWDPTLLRLSGRRGRNFPHNDAYPPDSAAAVAQLEQQRAEGISHLVVPSASMWWLEHYEGLAERLCAPVHADPDCLIFDLDAAA